MSDTWPWWVTLLRDILSGMIGRRTLEEAGKLPGAPSKLSLLEIERTGFNREDWEAPIREAICKFLERNVGDPYTYGAEIKKDDPDPATGDCSEYMEQAYIRAGLEYPDGANNQRTHCRGRKVKSPKPGDPFFLGPNAQGIPHTGAYVGGGFVIHASGDAKAVVKVPIAKIEAHRRFEGWFRHPQLAWNQEDRA